MHKAFFIFKVLFYLSLFTKLSHSLASIFIQTSRSEREIDFAMKELSNLVRLQKYDTYYCLNLLLHNL